MKRKLLIPLLGVASVVGVVTPLVACSKEQEEKKEDVTITFGALNGNIMGGTEVKVKPGTKWSDINLPKVEPYEGDYVSYNYVLAGWFNGNKMMTNDMVIENDMYITAKFIAQDIYASSSGDWTVTPLGDGTAKITGYSGPYNGLVALPEYSDSTNAFPIVEVEISYFSAKSLYVSKNVKKIHFSADKYNLLSVIVDPENEYLTSRDANGKECNCAFDKELPDNADRTLWVGTRGSIIPEGITILAPDAFSHTTVKSVILPSTLTLIDNWGFYGCDFLEEITIPSNLTALGTTNGSGNPWGQVFYSCDKLKSVTFLGTKIEEIPTETFYGCKSLESIVVPEGVKTIGDDCFRQCNNLKSVSLPLTLEEIENPGYQFRYANKMESFVVASGNEYYSSGSNDNCLMDKYDGDWQLIQGFGCSTIPNNCKYIDSSSFYQMPIKSVHIPASVVEMGSDVFSSCDQLSQVTFDAGSELEYISDECFLNCKSLESISLPSTIEYIGDGAFGNSGLKEINKLENLYYIGDEAFEYTFLETFYIPGSIDQIGYDAFYASHIRTMEFGGTKAEFVNKLNSGYIDGAFDDESEARFINCSDGELDLNHVLYHIYIDTNLDWYIDDSNTYDLFADELTYSKLKYSPYATDDRNEFNWEITQGANKVKWDENLPGRLVNVSAADTDIIKVKISLKAAPEFYVTTEIEIYDL